MLSSHDDLISEIYRHTQTKDANARANTQRRVKHVVESEQKEVMGRHQRASADLSCHMVSAGGRSIEVLSAM